MNNWGTNNSSTYCFVGSPSKSVYRTFTAAIPFPPKNKNLIKTKELRQYQNPIYLALEWEEALNTGFYSSQADLARKLGISRARVTQVLQLLKLEAKAILIIKNLGSEFSSPVITERLLREIIKRPMEHHVQYVRILTKRVL